MENNDSNNNNNSGNSSSNSTNNTNTSGSGSGSTSGLFTDALKKVFSAGVSAAFMTEENIRSHLADLKLPKEILSLVIQQANKSKEELMQKVGKEIINMIGKIDFVSEASKFVENHKFKISAEIEVIKKEKKD